MLQKLLLNLQLFADGGEGGSTANGEESPGEKSVENQLNMSRIPERARKNYQMAMEKHAEPVTAEPKGESELEQVDDLPQKKTYAEIIKSDDYKNDHQEYMDKVIGERLKKYKSLEGDLARANDMLSIVAQKYGIDVTSETFSDDLESAISNDNSWYDQYALEHGMSNEEAKKFLDLKRQTALKDIAEEEERRQQQVNDLTQRTINNAEITKQKFPNFDLEKEMGDERFRRLCAATNGDTTAAFLACHPDKILQSTAKAMSEQITKQMANAVAAGQKRPQENGLSDNASSIVETDFRNMNLKQLREYAAEQRKKQRGR